MPFPYFQFYPSDWRSDPKVAALTLEERGAYLEVLCLMWEMGDESGSLPDDDVLIARQLRLHLSRWRRLRAVLLDGPNAVLHLENGLIVQRRLQKERRKAGEKSEKNRRNVGERWRKTEGSKRENEYDRNTKPDTRYQIPDSKAEEGENLTPREADEALPELPPLTAFSEFRLTAKHRHIAREAAGLEGAELKRVTMAWQADRKRKAMPCADWNADWLAWVLREAGFQRRDAAAAGPPMSGGLWIVPKPPDSEWAKDPNVVAVCENGQIAHYERDHPIVRLARQLPPTAVH